MVLGFALPEFFLLALLLCCVTGFACLPFARYDVSEKPRILKYVAVSRVRGFALSSGVFCWSQADVVKSSPFTFSVDIPSFCEAYTAGVLLLLKTEQ